MEVLRTEKKSVCHVSCTSKSGFDCERTQIPMQPLVQYWQRFCYVPCVSLLQHGLLLRDMSLGGVLLLLPVQTASRIVFEHARCAPEAKGRSS